jgi:hypothetical protein
MEKPGVPAIADTGPFTSDSGLFQHHRETILGRQGQPGHNDDQTLSQPKSPTNAPDRDRRERLR